MQEAETINIKTDGAMSDEEIREFKESIKSIGLNIGKINENFANFCMAITGRVITLETKQEAHDTLHDRLDKAQKEFQDSLIKRITLILSIVGGVVALLTIYDKLGK